jgi:ketosteroid isomerase-like protein
MDPPPKTDTKGEQEKIRALFQNWVKDTSENEIADSYFKYVTDDFIIMEAGRDQSSNKEKMKVEIESLFASNTFNVENWQSQEVIVRDDIAIHRYSGVVIIKSKTDTTKLEVSLKYLDVLKKDKNGDWKVYIHSNSPNE